jgi:kynurenine formamidase
VSRSAFSRLDLSFLHGRRQVTVGWRRRLQTARGVSAMCLAGTTELVRRRSEVEGLPKISRRAALLGAAGAATVVAIPGNGLTKTKPKKRARDLTHLFRAGFPVYTGDPPTRSTLFSLEVDGFYSQQWIFGEHSGTHMDAPGHFVAGGRFAPEISLAELFVPAVVIDISDRVAANSDAVVEVDDLVDFEHRHGRIPRHAGVFMYSGWESRVDDPAAFKNAGPDGHYHFPGFGIEALNWLLENRKITCIGVDTLSLDFGASTTFDVHLTLLGADKYGLENLANLSRIPPRGSLVYVGLIPWEQGSGGPCRVVAQW